MDRVMATTGTGAELPVGCAEAMNGRLARLGYLGHKR